MQRSDTQWMVSRHLRLLTAVGAGAAIALLLPASFVPITRLMVGWNAGVILFLILIGVLMAGCTGEDLQARYEQEDATAPMILALVSVAALVCIVAIVTLLATFRHVDPAARAFHLILAALTVMGSWFLVPVAFALHYAGMFYSTAPERRPLSFPEDQQWPVFWDFIYFSFTIAAACQTADISTRSASIRKVVAAQSVLAFIFNAAVFGFAVNVSAGLVGG